MIQVTSTNLWHPDKGNIAFNKILLQVTWLETKESVPTDLTSDLTELALLYQHVSAPTYTSVSSPTSVTFMKLLEGLDLNSRLSNAKPRILQDSAAAVLWEQSLRILLMWRMTSCTWKVRAFHRSMPTNAGTEQLDWSLAQSGALQAPYQDDTFFFLLFPEIYPIGWDPDT